MDFVQGLPKAPIGQDAIWVVMDRLTKTAHFIPINVKYSMERLAEIYIKEIVKLHGVPAAIVSDQDPRFTSRFWQSLQKAMGTKLRFSTTYLPQTDGQTERTIQTLEDMLRACILDTEGSWIHFLPMIEFAYNNNHLASIRMTLYEALYGQRCRSPLYWDEVGERKLIGLDILQHIHDKIVSIRQRIVAAQSHQNSYTNKCRCDLQFNKGDKVFLKIAPMKGLVRFGKKGKLSLRYLDLSMC